MGQTLNAAAGSAFGAYSFRSRDRSGRAASAVSSPAGEDVGHGLEQELQRGQPLQPVDHLAARPFRDAGLPLLQHDGAEEVRAHLGQATARLFGNPGYIVP